MIQSERGRINMEELRKWARNTLLFSSPALLAFLLSLQGSTELSEATIKVAIGMAYQALLASLIDLIKKVLHKPEYQA